MSESGVCEVCGYVLPVGMDVACPICIDCGLMSRKMPKLNSGVSHSVLGDVDSVLGRLAELGVGELV